MILELVYQTDWVIHCRVWTRLVPSIVHLCGTKCHCVTVLHLLVQGVVMWIRQRWPAVYRREALHH